MRGTPTEALILRSVAFGESDRILHLLVLDAGPRTASAKGARRNVRRLPGTLAVLLVALSARPSHASKAQNLWKSIRTRSTNHRPALGWRAPPKQPPLSSRSDSTDVNG